MEEKVKKTLKVVADKKYSNMLRLVFQEGGAVPAKFSGLYKSRAVAQNAVEQYNRELALKKVYPSAPYEPKKVAADAPLDVKPLSEAKVIEREAPKPKKAAPEKRSELKDGEAKNTSRV